MPFITGQWFAQSKLFQYNEGLNQWEAHSPSRSWEAATRTIHGQYDGKLWRCNGTGGNDSAYFRLESGVWVEYDEPYVASNQGPSQMCQSYDGAHIYSAFSGYFSKFNGVSWDQQIVPFSTTANSCWCDTTGQYVYLAPGDSRQTLLYSDDYGATWSNIYSVLPRLDVTPGGVFGFGTGPTHTAYISCRRVGGYYEGFIFAGNRTSPWAQVVYSDTYAMDTRLWGFDSDNLFCTGYDGSGGARPNAFVLRRNGAAMDMVLAPSDGRIDQKSQAVYGIDGTEIFAIFQKRWDAFGGQSYRSTDGGDTWVQIDTSPQSDSLFYGLAYEGIYAPAGYSSPPYLQNQDPAPGSSGNSYDTQICLEVVDDEDDVNVSTIEIEVDGVLAWTANNPVQPGFSGYYTAVADGFLYKIRSWDIFDPGSHTIRVTGSDLAGNPFDESYSFETDALETLCDFSQWGQYQWGQTQWGSIEQPYVTSVQAVNEYTIRVEYNCLEAAVDPEALGGYLNPLSYSISGGYRQLTPLSVSYPATWTVDITTLEMTDGATYVLTQTALPVTSSHAFTGIGVHPYIIGVDNSDYGILDVTFSEEMENDRSYSSVSSYTVVPIGNYPVVHVTDVLRVSGTQVQLSFTGGGSPYILTVSGLMDVAGNYIDPNTYRFHIDFPGIDELLAGDKIFVDTDLGAVQLTVSPLSKRRIEDLSIQRAKNLGHSAQVSLISGALKDSGINRDEQKLKLFKG